MRYCPSRRGDYRLAVVVSRKVHKSAVVRNRIRRRVYETMRELKKEDQANWPFDMVLTAYSETLADMPAKELTTAVENLLTKAKIIAVK
jgi:ribonuclease P protein component